MTGMTSTDAGNPVIARRLLAAALRELRERAGKDRADLARLLGTERRAERLERGDSVRLRVAELAALLDEYGVTDEPTRREVDELRRAVDERGWWSSYGASLRPLFGTMLGLEAAAGEIQIYASTVVPGLLQTEDYAHAIMSASIPRADRETVDRRIKARLERQERFRARRARLYLVLDEGALRREVGGREVWRGQLERLTEIIASPLVTVQVLRFATGAPPTVTGPFALLHLQDTREWIAYTELNAGDRLDEADGAALYRDVFGGLMALADSPTKTVGTIRELLRDWS